MPALVLIKGKIIIKKGRENIYLPAKAINIASKKDTKIIEDLIKNVQPTEEAVPIYRFNFSKIDLEFWDSTSEKEKKKVTLVIQHKIVNESWKIPAMSLQELDEHNTKVLAVYRPPEQPKTFHAVFVKSFKKKGDEHEFTCVNSWGDKNCPELIISSKDMHALHYISLIESGSGKDLVEAGATPLEDADSDEVICKLQS